MRFTPLLIAATGLTVAACSSGGGMTGTPMPPVSSANNPVSAANDQRAIPDAGLNSLVVYTMSNESSRNDIEGYTARNGKFQRIQAVDTRGRGDPSISGMVQGALALGDNGRLLFAVDAGSNEITSFRVGSNGLTFAGKVMSNGKQPVSLAVHDDLLYVVNAGSADITGFKIAASGRLHPIAKSTRPLSSSAVSNVGAAEISFDPAGSTLVVTEKFTSKIDTYSVNNDVPSGPSIQTSSGTEPFGFAFAPGTQTMVVSDAFNGAPGAGAASSYDITQNGLKVISPAVPDENTAPCWVVISPDGRIAFASNTGSDTISAYSIGSQGDLALTTGDGISAMTDKGPADLALAANGKFLFVANLKGRTLGTYRVGSDGKLGRLKDAPQLPPHATGLAALPM